MNPITTLAVTRIGLGAAILATPTAALRLGLLPPTAPHSPLVSRLFAAREVALGVVTLLAAPEQRARVAVLGALVDAADALSGVAAIRSGEVAALRGVGFVAVAAGAVATGVHGAVTEDAR